MRKATLAAAFTFAETSDSTGEFFSVLLIRDTATSERVFRFDSCCPLPRCCSSSLDLRTTVPTVPPVVDRADSFDNGGKEEDEEEVREDEEEDEKDGR